MVGLDGIARHSERRCGCPLGLEAARWEALPPNHSSLGALKTCGGHKEGILHDVIK